MKISTHSDQDDEDDDDGEDATASPADFMLEMMYDRYASGGDLCREVYHKQYNTYHTPCTQTSHIAHVRPH